MLIPLTRFLSSVIKLGSFFLIFGIFFISYSSAQYLNPIQSLSTSFVPEVIVYSPIVNVGKSENLLAAILQNNDINVYNVDTGSKNTGIFTFLTTIPKPEGDGNVSIGDIAFSPFVKGNLFAATAESISTGQTFTGALNIYSVDSSNGAFTPVPSSPFITPNGTFPYKIAFSPVVNNGTNLFLAFIDFYTKTVYVYNVDTKTGFLTFIQANSPLSTESPINIAFSPLIISSSGVETLFAAVANLGSNTVSVYSVNTVTGVFTLVDSYPTLGSAPQGGLAFSPLVNTSNANSTDRNLFAAVGNIWSVTGLSTASIAVYQVNLDTGIFSNVPNSPFACGDNLRGIAFSPVFNSHLYAAAITSSEVKLFEVNKDTGVFTWNQDNETNSGLTGIAFSPKIVPENNVANLFAATTLLNKSISVFEMTTQPPTATNAVTYNQVTIDGTDYIQTSIKPHLPILYSHLITWNAPTIRKSLIKYFLIYRDKNLCHLLAKIPNTPPLKFTDPVKKSSKKSKYYIVVKDIFGNTSIPVLAKPKPRN